MALEFQLRGIDYRADKLDALTQFHVSRRVTPLLPALLKIYQQLQASGGKPLSGNMDALADAIMPFADVLAHMSDSDVEYVIGACLARVKRKTEAGYVAMWNAPNKICMFDDADLGVLLPLVVRVIQDSLGPFILGWLTNIATPESPKA